MKKSVIWMGLAALAVMASAAWKQTRSSAGAARAGSTTNEPPVIVTRGGSETVRREKTARSKDPGAEAQAKLDWILAGLRSGERGAFESIPDWNPSAAQLRLIIQGLMESDLDPKRMDPLLRALLLQMGMKSGGEMLAFIDDLTKPAGPDGKIEFPRNSGWALGGLGERQPELASRWLIDHPEFADAPESDVACRAVLATLARDDFSTAWGLLEKLPIRDKSGALRAIGSGVTRFEDRTTLLEQARSAAETGDSQNGEAPVESVLKGIAAGLAGSHETMTMTYSSSVEAVEAIAWVGAAGLSPEQIRTVAGSLMPGGSSHDTELWIGWLQQNAAPERMASEIAQMMSFWTQFDGGAQAEQWIQDHADDPVKGAASEAFVTASLSAGREEAARRVALLAPEGAVRDRLLKKVDGGSR